MLMRALTLPALLAILMAGLQACSKPAEPPASVPAVEASAPMLTPQAGPSPLLTLAPAPGARAEPEALQGNAAIAEQAIPQFHMALNDARFEEIYNNAAPELKKRKTQKQFLAQIKAVHSKLGAISGTDRQSWRSEEQFPSTLVTFTFKSAYAAGEAIEEFVFRVEDQKAALAGYSIQSSALKRNKARP